MISFVPLDNKEFEEFVRNQRERDKKGEEFEEFVKNQRVAAATALVSPKKKTASKKARSTDDTEDRGDFEIFFSNTENVPSEKQMPYIMMMATDCIAG